jgi:hypothetical protein
MGRGWEGGREWGGAVALEVSGPKVKGLEALDRTCVEFRPLGNL